MQHSIEGANKMELVNVGQIQIRPEDIKIATPVVLASDNAGYDLKKQVIAYLEEAGIECIDCNPEEGVARHYPEWSHKAAQKIMDGSAKSCILICGTGIGIGMAAMKCPGVYGVRADDAVQVKIAREKLDVNMLSFGQRVSGLGLALEMVYAFVCTAYDPKNEEARQIREAEAKYLKTQEAEK